jgi:DNA-binding response OmpR family regulator
MRVLVVEDDAALALFLQRGLQMEGHEVDCVGDGDAALEQVERFRPDLVVLDLSLPRRDGIEVLESMRRRSVEAAVLVLTGRSDLEQRVYCLNAGADDFLQKPFSFHELTARCRAVLRRRAQYASPELEFGGVCMNLLQRAVKFDGKVVELTGKEFAVLEVLLRRRGHCISRSELLSEVWPGTPESTGMNLVDVYVTYLRRKFAESQRQNGSVVAVAQVIETVRGAGYRLRVVGSVEKPIEMPASMGLAYGT